MIRISTNKVSLNGLKQRFKQTVDRLPVRLGATAVEYVHGNFLKQGFVDKTTHKWPARKKADRNSKQRALLVQSGRLRRDVRVRSVNQSYVVVGTSLPYAAVHNEGGTINHPGGTAYFVKNGETIWVSNRKAKSLETTRRRRLARTKPHRISMPQRQFMPNRRRGSQKLSKMLNKVIVQELNKIR